MNVDVTSEIVIKRPRPKVAAYAADPSNAPAWYENIKEVHWRTPPPLAVGSKVAFVAIFMGRRLEYTYEIVEYQPGARLVMNTGEGPFPMETIYTWEEVEPGSTRMSLRNHGSPAGFSSLLAPLMASSMRRANQRDLLELKSLLEA
jgi:hypothetical protein